MDINLVIDILLFCAISVLSTIVFRLHSKIKKLEDSSK
jgi:hypothetical protein